MKEEVIRSRIDAKTMEELQKRARQQDVPLSHVLRQAIRAYIATGRSPRRVVTKGA